MNASQWLIGGMLLKSAMFRCNINQYVYMSKKNIGPYHNPCKFPYIFFRNFFIIEFSFQKMGMVLLSMEMAARASHQDYHFHYQQIRALVVGLQALLTIRV